MSEEFINKNELLDRILNVSVTTGKQYQPRRKKDKVAYGDYQPMKCEQIEL